MERGILLLSTWLFLSFAPFPGYGGSEDSTESSGEDPLFYFPFNRSAAFPRFTQVGAGYGPFQETMDIAVQYHFRFFTFRNELKRRFRGGGWYRIEAALTGKLFRIRDRFHFSFGIGLYHRARAPLDRPLDLFSGSTNGVNGYIILERYLSDRFSLSLESAFGPRFGGGSPGPVHIGVKAHLHLFEEPEPPSIDRAED